MATRIRIGKQLELSATPYSILRTGAANEQEYVVPGANGTVLTIAAGIPTWAAPASVSFTITDGTTPQTINTGDTITFDAGNGLTRGVSATDTVTYTAKLSTDTGNGIVFGTDNGLFVPQAQLLTNATWADATNTLTLTFANGSTVAVPIVDVVGAFLSDFTIAGDTGTDLVNNHETLTFVGGSGVTTAVTGNTVTFSIDLEREVFVGLTTGSTVTLAATPLTLEGVYRNGLEQIEGAGEDYTIAGAVITFVEAFGNSGGGAGGEKVVVKYYIA